MKKVLWVVLVLLFGSLCFAKENPIDDCERMAITLFEKGTYLRFIFQEKNGNVIRKSIINKNNICSINCYENNVVIVYSNGNSDNCNYNNCELSQDRNGNIIINVTMLDS